MSQLRRINSMPHPIHKQVAFVRRTELIELRNRRKELLTQVELQATENASLRSDKAKVDAALAKFTASNNEFSVTRDRHLAEMRQLRDEVQSNNKRCQKFDHKIRTAEDELHEMKELLRRYRGLIDKESLEGAETLAERLQENVESIREKDLEIQNLRNEIESLTLSQQEEIKSEKLQNRQAKKRVHDLQKELEATMTRLKETSKEIDVRNMHNFRKSSTSVGTLQSKSEKSLPRAFASQKNSESLVSSHQRAKLYAANRQRRIRKETEKEDRSSDQELKRQHQMEEESALFQARHRKRLSEEEELHRTRQLEEWERMEKGEEKTIQWAERQNQSEETREPVRVDPKYRASNLKELRDKNDEEEKWTKSEDGQCSSVGEEIDQRLHEPNRRPNERRRCVEKRLPLEAGAKTRPIEERSILEERKRNREGETKGKRLEPEEREVETKRHVFEVERSRTHPEKQLLLIEEATEDSEERDSHETQPIQQCSVDLRTYYPDVETKGKCARGKKEYVFTRSTVHLHQGHPTHRMKLVPWTQGGRHTRSDSP